MRPGLAAAWAAAVVASPGRGSSAPAAASSAPLPAPIPVSADLFAALERSARLVDIAYCVGTTGTGIAPPFSCVSRCRDFPALRLVTTWNSGVLMRDSCGYVAADDARREILVAFRGTYSIANTVEDLRTGSQPYMPYEPGGEDVGRPARRPLAQAVQGTHTQDADPPACTNCTVHMGFYDSWRSARSLVLPAVAAARQPPCSDPDNLDGSDGSDGPDSDDPAPYRIHLLGHSLGGAVAALAALEMRVVLGWDVRVTTFGEPRIGNDRLAAFLEEVFTLDRPAANATTATTQGQSDADTEQQYLRVTHRNDPVPLLPLADWGYSAHAGEVFIAKPDLPPAPADVWLCRAGRADPACSAAGDDPGKDLLPPSLKLWELFFAHRDYFWRLGLCVPSGGPFEWWRQMQRYLTDTYGYTHGYEEEL